jgi:RNA polymerase primary sigma factor
LSEGIQTLLGHLTKKERTIIRLRYGLTSGDGQKRTLQEVARTLDLTRERIRQIEERALQKLLWYYLSSEIAEIYPAPQTNQKKKPQ